MSASMSGTRSEGLTADRFRRFLRTPKGTLLALFVPLVFIASATTGWGLALPHLVSAIAGACLVELVAGSVEKKSFQWPSSAILSGAIVALVLAPETPGATTFAVGAIATASKYILRTPCGHFFNPAALALLLSIPLFATGQSWWGALPDLAWPWLIVLLLAGAFLVDRINKYALVLSFLGTCFGLFTLVGLVNPAAVAEMFRPPFVEATLFLAFFMLTDPPTSPGRTSEQIWIGAAAGVASCLGQLLGAGQAYLLVGLLAGNLLLAARRLASRTAL